MDDKKEKRSIKGIKEKLVGKFKGSRDKEKVWGLRKKPTKVKEGTGKVTIVPSNSYTIDKEEGKGFVYYEGVPEGAEVYAAYYVDKAVKNTVEKERKQMIIIPGMGENSTKEKASQNKDSKTENSQSKSKKWRIIPIVLVLGAGALSLRGCTSEQSVVEQKVTPFEYTVYDTENPSIPTWGIQGQAAQEGKFVNEMQGQGSEGEFYNSSEVYDEENKSASNSKQYESLEDDLSEKLENLEGKEATTVDLADIQENVENMEQIYEDKSEILDEKVDDFLEYVNKYPDGNTQKEEDTTNILSEEFYENKDLVEENKEVVEDLINKAQTGKVQIDKISKAKDGDITIEGKHIEEVVKEQKITGIKAAAKNLQDFFKGLFAEKSEEER